MIRPRCPDPELLGMLIEDRLGRSARARVLRHAADCASCRRQLAIGSLSPNGPLRASVSGFVHSGKLTVCAGVLLGLLVLRFLGSGSDPDPAPVARAPRPVAPRVQVSPAPRSAAPSPAPPATAVPRGIPAVSAPRTAPEPEEWASIGAVANESETVPATAPDPLPAIKPRRLDSVVVEATPPPTSPAPKVAESEAMGRLAILDPFGSLSLEGVGGRSTVQGSRVVPVEARLTAVGRSSGFRLGDGIRVQLAPGCSVSVFQNLTRRCAGLAVLQGTLLVESTQPQSLYLRREGTSGQLEGWSGPVLVNAGARADSVTVTPMGATGVVWRKTGEGAIEIPPGDTLASEAAAQEVAARGGKPKPSLARFISWPEPTSLFYSSFEDDVQGMERPTVVQGSSKDGFVSAVAGGKGRKTIELTLPASLANLPQDATLRLRVRTTATRLQIGSGGGKDSSRGAPVIVPQRNRSETTWTAVTLTLGSLDLDHHGRGDKQGGRQGLRGITFTAEPPSKVSVEELVFDIDEIEISRS